MRMFRFGATIACSLLLAGSMLAPSPGRAQEPIAEAARAAQPGRVQQPGRGGKRKAPDRMVLCRGPRGAVYARAESVGCRQTLLSPGNLVDFGAGRGHGCTLRPRAAIGPEQEPSAGCEATCRARGREERCVVSLLRGEDGEWRSASPEVRWEGGAEAIAVCCRD